MSDASAALYARVRLYLPIAHETAGAACTRHSLRPLIGGFKEINGKARAKSRRENAKPCLLLFDN